MNSVFKICKNGNCGISIIGLEKDNEEYVPETSSIVTKRRYKYTESITINVVKSITSNGDETLRNIELVTHADTGIDLADIEFPIDGLYVISHIILPTQTFIATLNNTAGYSTLYYYNENTDTYLIYNPTTNTSTATTLEEIMEVNPDAVDTSSNPNSIVRTDLNTFCTCYINTCFYKLCKSLLTNFCGKCINKLANPKQDVYNRDIIWMTINIIKYLISLGQYYEALRILESITQCGNICEKQEAEKGVGCGCNS